jgi:predicted cupin superfamily sugar epimerase
MNAEQIIDRLQLTAHPEGGYFRETYRSDLFLDEKSLLEYTNGRNLKTAIYFLLKSGQKSAFHRLRSDEFWYFHQGSPLEVYIIHPDGRLEEVSLGNDFTLNQTPQLLLPAGTWFAARCVEEQSFTLISCSVAPGFDFTDFELADREKLSKQFPQHSTMITELT